MMGKFCRSCHLYKCLFEKQDLFKFHITNKSNYNYFGCTIAFTGFEFYLKTIIVINCLVIL